jgi:hypothetical protein
MPGVLVSALSSRLDHMQKGSVPSCCASTSIGYSLWTSCSTGLGKPKRIRVRPAGVETDATMRTTMSRSATSASWCSSSVSAAMYREHGPGSCHLPAASLLLAYLIVTSHLPGTILHDTGTQAGLVKKLKTEKTIVI